MNIKNKKVLFGIIAAALVLLVGLGLGLSALLGYSLDGTRRYKVRFEENGGSAVRDQKVVEGELIPLETVNSVRSGYALEGWYTESDLSGEKWDLETDTVTKNMTLYASWTIEEYTLTISETENYSVKVTRDGTEITSGEKVTVDDVLTVTATSGEGYLYATPAASGKRNGFVLAKETLHQITEDVTVYATLTPRNDLEYTVNYITEGTNPTVLFTEKRNDGVYGGEVQISAAGAYLHDGILIKNGRVYSPIEEYVTATLALDGSTVVDFTCARADTTGYRFFTNSYPDGMTLKNTEGIIEIDGTASSSVYFRPSENSAYARNWSLSGVITKSPIKRAKLGFAVRSSDGKEKWFVIDRHTYGICDDEDWTNYVQLKDTPNEVIFNESACRYFYDSYDQPLYFKIEIEADTFKAYFWSTAEGYTEPALALNLPLTDETYGGFAAESMYQIAIGDGYMTDNEATKTISDITVSTNNKILVETEYKVNYVREDGSLIKSVTKVNFGGKTVTETVRSRTTASNRFYKLVGKSSATKTIAEDGSTVFEFVYREYTTNGNFYIDTITDNAAVDFENYSVSFDGETTGQVFFAAAADAIYAKTWEMSGVITKETLKRANLGIGVRSGDGTEKWYVFDRYVAAICSDISWTDYVQLSNNDNVIFNESVCRYYYDSYDQPLYYKVTLEDDTLKVWFWSTASGYTEPALALSLDLTSSAYGGFAADSGYQLAIGDKYFSGHETTKTISSLKIKASELLANYKVEYTLADGTVLESVSRGAQAGTSVTVTPDERLFIDGNYYRPVSAEAVTKSVLEDGSTVFTFIYEQYTPDPTFFVDTTTDNTTADPLASTLYFDGTASAVTWFKADADTTYASTWEMSGIINKDVLRRAKLGFGVRAEDGTENWFVVDRAAYALCSDVDWSDYVQLNNGANVIFNESVCRYYYDSFRQPLYFKLTLEDDTLKAWFWSTAEGYTTPKLALNLDLTSELYGAFNAGSNYQLAIGDGYLTDHQTGKSVSELNVQGSGIAYSYKINYTLANGTLIQSVSKAAVPGTSVTVAPAEKIVIDGKHYRPISKASVTQTVQAGGTVFTFVCEQYTPEPSFYVDTATSNTTTDPMQGTMYFDGTVSAETWFKADADTTYATTWEMSGIINKDTLRRAKLSFGVRASDGTEKRFAYNAANVYICSDLTWSDMTQLSYNASVVFNESVCRYFYDSFYQPLYFRLTIENDTLKAWYWSTTDGYKLPVLALDIDLTSSTYGGFAAGSEYQLCIGDTYLEKHETGKSFTELTAKGSNSSDKFEYTITYDPAGGELTGTYPTTYSVLNAAATPLPLPIREGYLFTGWYIGEDQITTLAAQSSDIILTAKWALASSYDMQPTFGTWDNYAKSLAASNSQTYAASGNDGVTTVFIGDSFFDNRYWSTYITDLYAKDALVLGVAGSTTEDWYHYLTEGVFLTGISPKNLAVNLGNNDFYNDGLTDAQFLANSVTFYNAVHEEMPNTQIYVFSAIRRHGGNEQASAYMAAGNALLRSWCADKDWITYVDLTGYNISLKGDGVHPAAEAYSTAYLPALESAGCVIEDLALSGNVCFYIDSMASDTIADPYSGTVQLSGKESSETWFKADNENVYAAAWEMTGIINKNTLKRAKLGFGVRASDGTEKWYVVDRAVYGLCSDVNWNGYTQLPTSANVIFNESACRYFYDSYNQPLYFKITIENDTLKAWFWSTASGYTEPTLALNLDLTSTTYGGFTAGSNYQLAIGDCYLSGHEAAKTISQLNVTAAESVASEPSFYIDSSTDNVAATPTSGLLTMDGTASAYAWLKADAENTYAEIWEMTGVINKSPLKRAKLGFGVRASDGTEKWFVVDRALFAICSNVNWDDYVQLPYSSGVIFNESACRYFYDSYNQPLYFKVTIEGDILKVWFWSTASGYTEPALALSLDLTSTTYGGFAAGSSYQLAIGDSYLTNHESVKTVSRLNAAGISMEDAQPQFYVDTTTDNTDASPYSGLLTFDGTASAYTWFKADAENVFGTTWEMSGIINKNVLKRAKLGFGVRSSDGTEKWYVIDRYLIGLCSNVDWADYVALANNSNVIFNESACRYYYDSLSQPLYFKLTIENDTLKAWFWSTADGYTEPELALNIDLTSATYGGFAAGSSYQMAIGDSYLTNHETGKTISELVAGAPKAETDEGDGEGGSTGGGSTGGDSSDDSGEKLFYIDSASSTITTKAADGELYFGGSATAFAWFKADASNTFAPIWEMSGTITKDAKKKARLGFGVRASDGTEKWFVFEKYETGICSDAAWSDYVKLTNNDNVIRSVVAQRYSATSGLALSFKLAIEGDTLKLWLWSTDDEFSDSALVLNIDLTSETYGGFTAGSTYQLAIGDCYLSSNETGKTVSGLTVEGTLE